MQILARLQRILMFNTHTCITLLFSHLPCLKGSCNILLKSQSVQECKNALLKLSQISLLQFLIKYFASLSSILKEHCKICFTITLMSPGQIWLDIILTCYPSNVIIAIMLNSPL